MGKQTFGGDDDTEYTDEDQPKKLKLSKFELGPDYNIRDRFWKILGSYAATKTPGIDLKKVESQRIGFVKVAVSVIESRKSAFYGLSPQFVARYTLMMVLDGNWEDAFIEFIKDAKESRGEAWKSVVQALKHLLATEKYRNRITEYFKTVIRRSDAYPYVLFYLPKIKDEGLMKELKREISIFARGDTDENQMNAIEALALLSDEEDVKNVLLNLMNHWDVNIRSKVADVIKGMQMDEKMTKFLKSKIETEPDEKIKQILKRKVSKWKK